MNHEIRWNQGQFITECCLTGNSAYRCKAGDLFDAYKAWSGNQDR